MTTFMTFTAVHPGHTADIVVNVGHIVAISPADDGRATVLHLHGLNDPVLITLSYAEFYRQLDRVQDVKLVR